MRSSGRSFASAAFLFVLAVSGPMSHAQTPTPAAVRYESLREQEVRVATSPAADVLDFRVVIERYWTFVRQNRSNGYADNALWQAAALARDAYNRFGEDRDKFRAIQLFQWLADQYPHSSFVSQARSQVEELAAAQSIGQQAASTRPALQTQDAPAAFSTIRAVRREALPELVRVTIELDREVPFYQERLEGPSRLFFDLKSTRTVASLADAVFRYETDVIRHIRIGRHPGNTTRIVLDLEHIARYSVFTLYNPYRIVIDSERDASAPVPTLQAALAPLKLTAQVETAGTRTSLPSRIPPVPAVTPKSPPATSAPTAAPVASSPVPVVPSAPTVPASTTSPAPAATSTVPATPAPTTPSTNSSGKYSVARQLGLGVSRIVIDAGHGGHDPGASASDLSEAELVLDVALRLEKLLLVQPGMDVILTRRSDDYLTLEERTEIANRENADLFLSIHANASADETAQGVETYFLNFALNPKAEAVAARENAASGRTMNSLPSIIKAITLNSKLNESRDFAGSIQRSLVRGLRPGNKNIRDLGVKQAPFMVLIGAAMPSVLAEISFVTNRQEGRLLKTPAYRQRIAESLLAGILRYQQSLKKVQTAALN